MKNIKEFLDFNTHCPICNNELTLFAQFDDSTCFKASQSEDIIYFEPFKKLGELSNDDFFELSRKNFKLKFNSSKVLEESSKQLYFFYLCNPAGFTDKYNNTDYEINVYKMCYYRSTPFIDVIKEKYKTKKRIMKVSELDESLSNKDETFAIKTDDGSMEKIYILHLNYGDKKTILWHYTVTTDQRKDSTFKPSVFEKELPELTVRPKLGVEDRDKLINKLDSWVLMS